VLKPVDSDRVWFAQKLADLNRVWFSLKLSDPEDAICKYFAI
jgi:hypothetical protein